MRIHTYRDLEVWKSAMDVVEEVYVVTRRFPREELYGLTSQVRRAGVSVPSNIAEGWGLESDRGFFHRLSIGQGSLAETETQLLIAERLEYVGSEALESAFTKISEVRSKLRRFRQVLVRDNPQLAPRR